MPLHEHPSRAYELQLMYSVPDDAWYLELDHIADQRTVMTAIVPDEDPERQPTVCVDPVSGHHAIPYDVVRWFMGHVEFEIERSRGWMELRPDLVEVIRALREEHLGVIDDEDFTAVLAELRATVAEVDLPAVLDAAFGRNTDGTMR
ncbi:MULTISPECIES: hypothetical protein [Streptomyces]|uniref:Uncharacterized protein n=1 Tax=Streptomyces solicathayae TaxID=3081768 RepID=A0ABZ0LQY2_9ACTN|nr:hypothetical protein [Streptomyces sp. HUAS YS2]WOX21895.1 hypothetical protein R2D22_11035 [Streptomyces sp. HUAS YS2]